MSKLSHFLDENGFEIIQCKDNGVGMDLNIVTRFLTKAGRSYYRSPEFERERAFFREKGVDFDPCSQFGIGFMSCFMLGDRINISTRRDYGSGRKWGDPTCCGGKWFERDTCNKEWKSLSRAWDRHYHNFT